MRSLRFATATVMIGLIATAAPGADRSLSVNSVATGVSAEFVLQPFEIVFDDEAATGVRPADIFAAGLDISNSPGFPALPGKTYFFAVPPHAAVTLEVDAAPSHEVAGVWIDPPPTSKVDVDADGEPLFDAVPNPDVYGSDRFFPEAAVRIVMRGVVRDLEYVQVQVQPFQWNPARGTLRVHERVAFRLQFAPLAGEPGPGLQAPAPDGSAQPAGGGRGRAGRRDRTAAGHDAGAAGRGRGARAVARGGESDAAETLSDALFMNGPVPAAWRVRRRADSFAAVQATANVPATTEGYKITVDRDGLQRVDYSRLAAAGLGAVAIANLKLELRGQTVPIQVFDIDNNGQLNGQDYILFHGIPNPDRWTATHVYWLSVAGGGRTMTAVEAFPAGSEAWPSVASATRKARSEANEQFFGQSSVHPDQWEPWVQTGTLESSDGNCETVLVPQIDYQVQTKYKVATKAGKRYQVRGTLIGRPYTPCIPEDRSVDVRVNGGATGNVSWSYAGAPQEMVHPFTLDYDANTVVEGANTITLFQAVRPSKLLLTHVDYVELDYEARLVAESGVLEFDGTWTGGALFYVTGITSGNVEVVVVEANGTVARLRGVKTLSAGPGLPLTLSFALAPSTQSRHVAVFERGALLNPVAVTRDTPSNLRNAALRGTYTVISHADLKASAQGIADWRVAEDGFSSQVLDVQDVYDEFTYGNVDNDAITDFLAYAFSSWAEPPLYVLLVGDSTDDPKDYRGLGVRMFIPHGDYVRQGLGSKFDLLLPSDITYALIAGGPDDYQPDLLIGRLPAQTSAEVENYARKLERYETAPAAAWNGRYLFVVDDDLFGNDATCEAGLNDSEIHTNDMICCYLNNAPPDDVILVSEDEVGWPEGSDILTEEHNTGVSVVTYFGHGSVTKLGGKCNTPLYQMWGDSHLSTMTNSVAMPIFFSVSCNVGRFEWVERSVGASRCMGETFLFGAEPGYIAFVAQSTTTTTTEGKAELQGAFDGLFLANSTFLPPMLPAAEGRERAGGVHFAAQMGYLRNPSIGDERRFDNAVTLHLLGDPAAHLKVTLPPPADTSRCSALAFCP